MRASAPWVALVVLAVLPYLGALEHPLLYDDRTLLDNAWLVRDAGLASVFAHDFWHGTRHAGSDLYRPVTTLALAWNARLAGSRAGFRLTNLALHAIVVLLVALALRSLARDESPLPFSAWMGAALFAVHPLASEAVLWAVGRAELLAAGFGLGAFLLLRAADRSAGVWRGLSTILAALSFFLALLSKESAAAWLVIAASWHLLTRRRSGVQISPLRWALALTPGLAVFALLRFLVVGGVPTSPHFLDNPLVVDGPWVRIVNAVLLLGRYLLKMVLPISLSVDYGYAEIPVVPLLPWGLLGASALVAVWIALLVVLRRASKEAAFLWAFVPAALAVTGNAIFPIGTIFAERLAYLPLFGLCGLAAFVLTRLPSSRARMIAASIILALLAARTVVRARDYRDLVTFTEATALASSGSAKAWLNLGRVRLVLLHRPAEALYPLERALGIWPEYPRALRLLSQAHAELGDARRAAELERRAEAAETAAAPDGNADDLAR